MKEEVAKTLIENQRSVPPELLRLRFDPTQFPFETTATLGESEGVMGQERALRSLDFGLHVRGPGYNLYVAGEPGTGKRGVVQSVIADTASTQPVPEDWCYVHNFQEPARPAAVRLPAGQARIFQRDMARLITALHEEFPKAFHSKDYEEQHQTLSEAFAKAHTELRAELEAHAKEQGFLIRPTQVGIVVIPLLKGKPLEPEELARLDSAEQADIQQREKRVDEAIRDFRQHMRAVQEDIDQRLAELNYRVAHYTSEHLFEALRAKYRVLPRIVAYLEAVQGDVQEHFEDFLNGSEAEADSKRPATRYAVNVLVDNQDTRGAPIVEEANPTYNNLVGRIEKKARQGVLYTDFTQIKAGSILRANGGYLILNIFDVLRNPFSWDALKRIIKRGEAVIEDIAETYGLSAIASVRPEPIPVDLRVVLIGSPLLYYLLHAYDEDFARIVKVKVDFDVEQAREPDAIMAYARFIATLCTKEKLPHFHREAVAAVLEQAARRVEHQHKLSLRIDELADLVREAAFWARRDGSLTVTRGHVRKAIEEKIFRSNLLEQRIREWIAEGTLMVDVRGAVVGQINGLSLLDLGDFSFGRPSRITARVFIGQQGIVNIDREAKMSGSIHSKAVLILAGYLAGRYARSTPLSLSATLAFEQSYGLVEGDSASVAELIALLSALGDIPVRQAIAVTGSVNQRGELQAVGGVNEKIEGYFALCRTLGLTGEQGVLIPRANIRSLMLNDEVIAAVRTGRFQIYAADTIDDAVEILTGVPAGVAQPDGSYPPNTVNAAVVKRLREFEERLVRLRRRYRPPRLAPEEEDEI